MKKISDQELISEMQRVYAEYKEVPSTVTWRLRSKISTDAYRRAFGSWEKALIAANIQKETNINIAKNRIIDDIKNAYISNKNAAVGELIRLSGHTLPTIIKYFGSVDTLLKISKIDLNNKISKENLIEDFKNVYAKIKKFPTAKELRANAKHNFSTFMRKFGSIEAVAEAAGITKEDVCLEITEEELLKELKELHLSLGRVPMTEDVNYKAKYSVNAYARAFGSFELALQKIGLTAIRQTRINQKCLICGASSSSMISHFSSHHPNDLSKQEMLVLELFKSGLSSRKIAAREDIIFKGGTSVNRVIRKYMTSEEIELLRVSKITSTLKEDYSTGKYDWVNELNRSRNTTQEAKNKNSDGLKEAYASGDRVSWNKGLTKETDERLANQSKSVSISMKNSFAAGEIEKRIGPESSNWSEDRDSVASRYRLGLNFSAEARGQIKKRANYKCEICDISQEKLEELGQMLECDHIIAICNGGLDDVENNSQALCPACHKEKTIKDLKKDNNIITEG